MSGACPARLTGDGGEGGVSVPPARAAADWLGLAAAPAFAMMALMTADLGAGMAPVCMGAEHGSPMSGMVPMYLMMSAFHVAPWLRLIAGRRR